MQDVESSCGKSATSLNTCTSISSGSTTDPKGLTDAVESKMSERLELALSLSSFNESALKHALINLLCDVLYTKDKYPTKVGKSVW